MDYLPERFPELSPDKRVQLDCLRKMTDIEGSPIMPYTGDFPGRFWADEIVESWLASRQRLLEEKIRLENEAKALKLRQRYQKLKAQLTEAYHKNLAVNGLQRITDDNFEVWDSNWVRLKKQREQDIVDAKLNARLELIEQDLYKKKLLSKYWDALSIRLQTILAHGSDLKVTNFPVPKKIPSVKLLLERARLQRRVDQEVQTRQHTSTDWKAPMTAEAKDFVRETVLTLCQGGDSLRAKVLDELQFDDVVSSRMQRMQQLALYRECGYLIREEFNRHFAALLKTKTDNLYILKQKYERIKRHQTEMGMTTDLVKPVKFSLSGVEDPARALYRVTEDQIVQFMKQNHVRVPYFLDDEDPNYKLVLEAKQTAAKGAKDASNSLPPPSPLGIRSPTPTPAPEDAVDIEAHLDKPVDELAREYDAMIKDFDKELLQLHDLKGRTTFACDILDFRAMYLRKKVLCLEEANYWSNEVQYKTQQATARLHRIRTNLNRARRMFEQHRIDYDASVKNDGALDHYVKRELHDASDLDGKRLIQMYRKRPHLFRGLKQVERYQDQLVRPRTADLKEEVTERFFTTMHQLESPLERPEDIDLKLWNKYCELRRKKMESEMNFWLKHMELDLYHGIYKNYVALEISMQGKVLDLATLTGKAETWQSDFDQRAEFVLTLTHGQVEIYCRPFGIYNDGVILVPIKRIEEKNRQLLEACKLKMENLEELVKYKEAVLLLQWEEEVHREKIADYEYERQFLSSQAAPKEFREMVGREFSEFRDEKYQQLQQSLKEQKQTFEKDIRIWKERVNVLQAKLERFQNDRHNANATMIGLSIELAERHALCRNIGIHADASESQMRWDLVLRRLRLQSVVRNQKQRMYDLKSDLWTWQKRTFPALYRDLRNP